MLNEECVWSLVVESTGGCSNALCVTSKARFLKFSWNFPDSEKWEISEMHVNVLGTSGSGEDWLGQSWWSLEWWRLLQYSVSDLKGSFLEVFLEFSWFWKIGNLQNAYFLRDADTRVHGVVCESTRLLQSAQKVEKERFGAIWRKTNVEVQKSKIRKVVESVVSTCGVTPEPVWGHRKRCWCP